MSDRAAFIAAINAAPDDDAPRLVFADWLDENGEAARAAFIRGQIAIARMERERRAELDPKKGVFHNPKRGGLDFEPTPAMVERDNLRNRYSIIPAEWFDFPDVEAKFSRGFAVAAKCSAADWLAHGDAITAGHPVREVRLTTWPEGVASRHARLRNWKEPPRLGGHVLDPWLAEWPGITFHLTETPTQVIPRTGWRTNRVRDGHLDIEQEIEGVLYAETGTEFDFEIRNERGQSIRGRAVLTNIGFDLPGDLILTRLSARSTGPIHGPNGRGPVRLTRPELAPASTSN